MIAMLLKQGVSAASAGAGRWVLHPELAPMLARAGASVDRSGSWIGASCTGNQGRKDDPDYVAALLRHGARVSDKRLVGQGKDGGRATALHYAVKAGFVKTVEFFSITGPTQPRATITGSLRSNGLSGLRHRLTVRQSGTCLTAREETRRSYRRVAHEGHRAEGLRGRAKAHQLMGHRLGSSHR
jgi:hypothetical protein